MSLVLNCLFTWREFPVWSSLLFNSMASLLNRLCSSIPTVEKKVHIRLPKPWSQLSLLIQSIGRVRVNYSHYFVSILETDLRRARHHNLCKICEREEQPIFGIILLKYFFGRMYATAGSVRSYWYTDCTNIQICWSFWWIHTGMSKVWEDLRMCHRLRNVMAQLVGSLQSYMMLEVIESAWKELMQEFKTTEDLDGLIGKVSLHSHFLYLFFIFSSSLSAALSLLLRTGLSYSWQTSIFCLFRSSKEGWDSKNTPIIQCIKML